YVGGMLALSIPPFHAIERGFYKSTAAVYLGFGVLALGGRPALLVWPGSRATATDTAQITELLVWGGSIAGGTGYLGCLWGEQFELRARAYVVAWMSGVLALSVGAQAFRLGSSLSIETVLYPINFVVAALVLGSVTTGMLLGHWYLIDRELSLEPFL